MRILVILANFHPDIGSGVSKNVLTEVRGLVARGHQVAIMTRRLEKNWALYQALDGYEIYRYPIPSKSSLLFWVNPLYSMIQVPKLACQLHQTCPFDIVYTHNPYQAIGLQRANLGIPVIYTFYFPMPEDIEIEARYGKFGVMAPFLGPVIKAVWTIERGALRAADIILVRSQFIKAEMRSCYGIGDEVKKIEIIPLPVEAKRFQFISDPKSVRESLGLPLNRSILLTVRRLVGRMGLQNLIDAMKLIVRQHPDALLLIGGKGYLENTLRERVRSHGLKSNIQLLGFIPEEKLPSYYQAADLFIIPTVELEGFGLSTIEALSCGTPTIATPVGANPEVVGPLGSEFLCRDATAEALAERINWWLSRGISAEVRQACGDYCVSRFAVESVVTSLEDIFAEAIRLKGTNNEGSRRRSKSVR